MKLTRMKSWGRHQRLGLAALLLICQLPLGTMAVQFGYIGCYFDNAASKDLSGLVGATALAGLPSVTLSGGAVRSSGMTHEMCASVCSRNGFAYFGVQSGDCCYCGDSYGNGVNAANNATCSTPCTGNNGQYCGGGNHNSVFAIYSRDNGAILYKNYKGNVTQVVFSGSWASDAYMTMGGFREVAAVSIRASCLQMCIENRRRCKSAAFSAASGRCYLMRLWGVAANIGSMAGDIEAWLPVVQE